MQTSSLEPAPGLEAWPPFRRVLAASSLDDAGVRAVLRAARLPLAPGARLVALHVLPPWAARAGRPAAQAGRALEGLASAAAEAAAAAGNLDPQVVPAVVQGWPATEIVRAAWQEGAELIVVGPPAARLGGSARATILNVLRRADLPMLVARTAAGRAYRSVLCAVDRSVTAVETVALGARLARGSAERLGIFHAYQVPFEPWTGAEAPEVEAEATALVLGLAREVAGSVEGVRPLVRKGEPCVEILRAAVEQRADLVVLGTHARSRLSRALHGSAAEWVIASAPLDVAIARPHRLTLEPR